MTEIAMNSEVEAKEFTEELSDEALDREGTAFFSVHCGGEWDGF